MAGHGTHVIPVSNGIFEDCQQIGVALWVFLWMLDRTTKEAPGDDGQIEGLVYGGRPIPARDIGNDLQMTVRTVHAHLKHLLDAGYLRTISFGDGIPPGYRVLKSKKWALESAEPQTSPKMADPRRIQRTPTKKLQGPLQKNCRDPAAFLLRYIETTHYNTQQVQKLKQGRAFRRSRMVARRFVELLSRNAP